MLAHYPHRHNFEGFFGHIELVVGALILLAVIWAGLVTAWDWIVGVWSGLRGRGRDKNK